MPTAPGTFHTSREIAASVDEVFAAISQPGRLEKWWGPAGFANTFHLCEFKPGGRWTLTMHGPDGRDYPSEYRFAEIKPPRKVIVEHVSEPHFRLTIELASSSAGTLVTWSQAFANAQTAARMKPIVLPANEQNLDRLAAEVSGHP
jgi:uncharacterized protein YndB with AHSA1/START domain